MSPLAKTCTCGRPAPPGSSGCALHPPATQTQSERLAAQPYRADYNAPEYRRNKRAAWERSGHRCEKCGAGLEGRSHVCDHIVPLSDGGTSELANLKILCADCNRAKTAADRRARAKGGART